MTEEDRRHRLIGWLQTIEKDITDLVIDDYVFWEIQELFKNNKELRGTPSIINQWMASAFIQATAVGVRRQTDKNPESISFYRVLTELKQYPSLASRAYHVSLYQNSSIPPELAVDMGNGTYDTIIGIGVAQPSPDQIQQDIDKLTTTVQQINKYVNKRVAHYDQNTFTAIPKFDDLSACLVAFEELIKKYKLLLTAIGLPSLLPTFQYDWRAAFRIPWVATRQLESDGEST